MTEEEMKQRDERLAWGLYCTEVADVSLARYREILTSGELSRAEVDAIKYDPRPTAMPASEPDERPPQMSGDVSLAWHREALAERINAELALEKYADKKGRRK